MGKASRAKLDRRQGQPSPNAQVVTYVPVTAPPWTPFERAVAKADEKWLDTFVRDTGCTREYAEAQMRAMIERDAIWLNSRYQVAMAEAPTRDGDYKVTHLSIKRIDKMPIHDWRELQRIKNELCGPDREAVEIYPAEARLTDESNQFHLWVLPAGMAVPFGFTERNVREGEWRQPEPNRPSQRPFE